MSKPGFWCQFLIGTIEGLACYYNLLTTYILGIIACGSTNLFWREALARIRFVRNDFWEGYN